MTSILKGLAALIAVLTVNVGGAHVAIAHQPKHNPVTVSKASSGAPADDAVTLRGQNHLKLFPPTPVPTPIPTPVPVAAPVVEQPAAAAPAQRHPLIYYSRLLRNCGPSAKITREGEE
jgi:hypothetical protein